MGKITLEGIEVMANIGLLEEEQKAPQDLYVSLSIECEFAPVADDDDLSQGVDYRKVIEMVKGFEKASGKTIPYAIKPRRAGDVAECWADSSKLFKATGWKAEYGIEEMCEHGWTFIKNKSV